MLKHTPPSSSAVRGFTLVELMITVAIVAVLATIAATSYTSQVQKSRRTDARSALLDLAGREEKLFSTTNAYGNTWANLGYGAGLTSAAIPVGSGYYNVTIAVPDPNQGGAVGTYAITAVAVGPQLGDLPCQSLTLNQLGQQGAAPGSAATCWGN